MRPNKSANLFSVVRRLLRVRELQGRLVGRRLVPVHVSDQLGTRGTVDDQIGHLKEQRHIRQSDFSFYNLEHQEITALRGLFFQTLHHQSSQVGTVVKKG